MKLLALCAFVGLAFGAVDYTGHKVYRAYPSLAQNEVIKTIGEELNLDFWSDLRVDGGAVDFRVSPEMQPRIEVILRHNRIRYEIFIEDVGAMIQAQMSPRLPQIGGDGSFDYSIYHTYDEINQWITNFPGTSNGLGSIEDVGTGKSFESRNIRAVKVSTGGLNKPTFVINCGLHSREWVTPATCMYTANRLVTDYNTDSQVTGILNNIDIYLIPTSNPDGYVHTWSNDRMWRKTRSPANSNGCLTNCDGVDPNRNWDDHWDQPGGASDNCCSDLYRGKEPFTEVEITNQRDFVQKITNVKAYIDVHAYSQYWMYPYGWTKADSPDEKTLASVASSSAAAIRAVHGKIYQTGSIADVIYEATGSTADYFYANGIKCSFAAELRDRGEYGFLLPENQIIPAAEEAFAGLMAIAENVVNQTC